MFHCKTVADKAVQERAGLRIPEESRVPSTACKDKVPICRERHTQYAKSVGVINRMTIWRAGAWAIGRNCGRISIGRVKRQQLNCDAYDCQSPYLQSPQLKLFHMRHL